MKYYFFILSMLIIACSSNTEEAVNTPPIASFTFENLPYYVNDEVSFENTSIDSDGTIVNWLWNFGDQNTSNERNPSHRYASEGVYTISLTVTDNQGTTDTTSKQLSITTQNQSKTFKLMCFNIHRGESPNGVYSVDAIAEVINSKLPDIVALQEVDFNTSRNGRDDMPRLIAEKTNMYYAFGKAIDYQGGEFGNVILSKFPMSNSQNHTLPSMNEARAAILSTITTPQAQFNFISSHWDYGESTQEIEVRKNTARFCNETFAKNERPSIIAGDFNTDPNSESITILNEKWNLSDIQNHFTFPSSNPSKKIDYIAFYPQTSWEIIQTEVINTQVSDHRPLLVTLKLKG